MVDNCCVHVRPMTMGRMPTSVRTCLVSADGIGEGGVFVANHLCCVREVVVCAVLPFPYVNLFNQGASAATVCVTDVSRFEDADKVRFVCRGSLLNRAHTISMEGN
jgi:hypothetical protein